MPAVSDLDCFRGALAGAVGVGAGPVAADDLGSGVLLQPVRRRCPPRGRAAGPRAAGLGVDQDRPVVAAAAEREVIDAEHSHRPGLRVGQRHDQPQHARPARRQAQRGGQPRPGPAGQGQRDRGERPRQRRGPPGAPRGQALDLLGERDRAAARVAAEEPAHRQPDHHPAGRRPARRPAAARSALCTRCEDWPHLGHAAASGAGTAPRSAAARSATSAASTITPARCGRRRPG